MEKYQKLNTNFSYALENIILSLCESILCHLRFALMVKMTWRVKLFDSVFGQMQTNIKLELRNVYLEIVHELKSKIV